MEKIVIIGSPGAGKTTLARRLGHRLNIKVYHLDRLFWRPGWKGETRDTRIDIMQDLIREKQWIIEGTYLCSSEPRLEAADTIIFLDIPAPVCLWRIIKRHREFHGRFRRDIPEGCTDKLTLGRILKVLAFPLREREILEGILRKLPPEKVIRLHSAKKVKGFLAQPEQVTNDMRNSSNTVPIAKEGLLMGVRSYQPQKPHVQKGKRDLSIATYW